MLELWNTDVETYEHSVNVSFMMYYNARDYNIDKNRALIVGLLHDVGKMEIDRNVLLKKGEYDDAGTDMAEMRKHPEYLYKRLKDVFPVLAEAALRHHTNQRENSYPRDLADLADTELGRKAALYVKALCKFDYEEARANRNDGWEKRNSDAVSCD